MTDGNVERQVRAVLGTAIGRSILMSCVLESLQMQSPKQALGVCEKYLKKNPNSASLLAIKALILVYLGKDLEGLELAKELVAQKPTDLTVLGNLDKVFVTANDYKASMGMFDEAFKLVSTEDIGALWFFSVLRTQDTKSLFSIALKLHSMFKGTRYLFWAVLALHLQTRSPAGKLDSEKAMRLAEKMIVKTFAGESISQRNLEELLLLIITLQGTANHGDALRILDSATGIAFPNEDERQLVRGDLLEKTDQLDQAIAHVEDLLRRRGIFDWNAWKLYVRSVDKCSQRDDKVAAMPALLAGLEALTDKRSLLLARVDAGVVFGEAFSSEEGLLNGVIEYIEEFKDKGCCVPDMRYTSDALPLPVLTKIAEHCATKSPSNVDDLVANIPWIRLEHIFRLRLKKRDPAQQSTYPLDAAIDQIADLLRRDDDLKGQQADGVAAAWMHLATLYVSRGADGDLLKAAGCGRNALELASDNFTVKMLLILIYLRLGSVLLALDLFRSLDIKQLQLDTLAYLISDHLLELGDFEHAEAFFHESFYIYDENRTQSWSLIAEAFSRGSYSNVPEFYEFARLLEYSMQAVACICGTIRTELMTKELGLVASYLEGLKPDELLFDDEFMLNLSDNRDRDVVDFVDHAGVVRTRLLDKLPTFGRTSILIYTFVPIMLRAILTDDTEQMRVMSGKFATLLGHVEGHPAGAAEKERLEFVKLLVKAASEYLLAEKQPQALIDALVALPPTAEVIVPQSIPTYESLTAIQWELERDHWTGLVLACLLRGVPGKSRRTIKSLAGTLIQSLENRAATRKTLLTEAISAVATLKAPESMVPEQWAELTLSWTHSLTSYRSICENSLAILRAACDSS